MRLSLCLERVPVLVVCSLLLVSIAMAGCGCRAPVAVAPVVEHWSVSPAKVGPGQVVTIRWQVSNVERVTIQPFGEVAASGELEDAPQQTLRYSLSASNEQGAVQRSQEVIVEEAATPSALPSATTGISAVPSATAVATESPSGTPEPSLTPTATSTSTPTSTPTSTSTPTPTPTVTATPGPTWQHPVALLDRHNVYHLRLVGAGQIRARATWSGAAANLALIINGPGQVGYYARKDGPSPLEIVYNVTEANLAAGDEWRLTVVNFGSGKAEGTLEITYPSGSSASPFASTFVNDGGYATSVSVIVLKRLAPTIGGTISGQATWSGSPANLALIINGPGQVGAYARQDGPSPLSVQYAASAGDLSHGDTWRVSLASFGAANAQGEIKLSYPYIWLKPFKPLIMPTLVSP